MAARVGWVGDLEGVFNPCYLAHRGFRARRGTVPVHNNARLEFPWKRHVDTMRFHVAPTICATTLLFFRRGFGKRGGERRIPGGGRFCFVDRIGGPLSLLSTHLWPDSLSCAPRKNATYCAKSIWPSCSSFFRGSWPDVPPSGRFQRGPGLARREGLYHGATCFALFWEIKLKWVWSCLCVSAKLRNICNYSRSLINPSSPVLISNE